jgi:putative ABC transport system permease protein
MALGASRRDLIGLVLRQGMAPTVIGIAIGFVGALGFTRLLAGQLYGVTPVDARTYATAAGAMLAVSAVASCLPAYRATTVDPLTVLRAD